MILRALSVVPPSGLNFTLTHFGLKPFISKTTCQNLLIFIKSAVDIHVLLPISVIHNYCIQYVSYTDYYNIMFLQQSIWEICLYSFLLTSNNIILELTHVSQTATLQCLLDVRCGNCTSAFLVTRQAFKCKETMWDLCASSGRNCSHLVNINALVTSVSAALVQFVSIFSLVATRGQTRSPSDVFLFSSSSLSVFLCVSLLPSVWKSHPSFSQEIPPRPRGKTGREGVKEQQSTSARDTPLQALISYIVIFILFWK